MRDYVFIGWGGNQELATKVKTILDETKQFMGIVGGVSENDPTYYQEFRKDTINATVIHQMNHCDQAIFLFHPVTSK